MPGDLQQAVKTLGHYLGPFVADSRLPVRNLDKCAIADRWPADHIIAEKFRVRVLFNA